MQIKSNYIDNWRLLNVLSITFPYTQEEIYTALEKEEFVGSDRSYCNDIKSPILKEILDTVRTKVPELLVEMCKQDQFKNDLWHLESKEQLINNSRLLCSLVCDSPGFTTSNHIDSRMTICSGMFFFNKDDDPDQSTYFYTTFTEDDPVRISSQYGNGWYAANTHYSWHIGSNNTLRNRYAIIFINQLILPC